MDRFGFVLLSLCAALALGCAGGDQPQDRVPEERYIGTYEYVYENNTELLVENHYIVFELESGALQGWYYGTSDEFDIGREGYYPGFFVAEMQDLTINDGRVSFTLKVSSEICFTEPVPLQYRSPEEFPSGQFERWSGPTGVSPEPVRYEGQITENRIELQARFGTRGFLRRVEPPAEWGSSTGSMS